jgi:two-component system OmpR family response regulator
VNVFIAEDDIRTLELLREGLLTAGHSVESCSNGTDAFTKLQKQKFDFIILDVMLPGMDGLELLKATRKKDIQTPAIFLSAKHTLPERLLGLSAGSDDYITKPFSLQELLLRMDIIVKRSKGGNETEIELSYADLKMNLVDREVSRGGVKIKLLSREFLLLEYFLKNAEKILTKSMILTEILEYQFEPQTNVVDVFVHRLRTKVDKDFDKKLIHTLRGVGYVLKT